MDTLSSSKQHTKVQACGHAREATHKLYTFTQIKLVHVWFAPNNGSKFHTSTRDMTCVFQVEIVITISEKLPAKKGFFFFLDDRVCRGNRPLVTFTVTAVSVLKSKVHSAVSAKVCGQRPLSFS